MCIGGDLNGSVFGAMVRFAAFGKHPRNIVLASPIPFLLVAANAWERVRPSAAMRTS